MQNKREFVLVSKQDEAKDVVSLLFKPVDNLGYKFVSGQYVDVKPSSFWGHSKSYTISSTPNDNLVQLTIKRQGDMSSAMIDMSIGGAANFDGPYGNFYPDKYMDDIVMIAGGIGITPFHSIIKNALESDGKAKITLIYSNKTQRDITFFDSLNRLTKSNPTFKIIYCLTREKITDSRITESGRISQNLINKYISPLSHKQYYICGSIGFVNDTWRMLKDMNIAEENIYTESFY
jgi:ferredoxin-NADP reductase